MSKRYFTLAELIDGQWRAQFGDYDRAVVQDELQDMRDNDSKARLRIVSSGDKQADIEQALAKLNEAYRRKALLASIQQEA
jgi:ACT domain-containing protein